jgi:hypothetical protein
VKYFRETVRSAVLKELGKEPSESFDHPLLVAQADFTTDLISRQGGPNPIVSASRAKDQPLVNAYQRATASRFIEPVQEGTNCAVRSGTDEHPRGSAYVNNELFKLRVVNELGRIRQVHICRQAIFTFFSV